MKTLMQYIIESRELFNPTVDINKLQSILQTISIDGFLDVDEVQYINHIIGKDLSNHAIHGLIAAYLFSKDHGLGIKPFSNISVKDAENFVKLMKKIPASRIDKVLGGGAEGCIVDLDDNRVMKIFYTGVEPVNMSWDELFSIYEEIFKGKYVTLPRVFRVKRPYVIREACRVNTKKCKDYYNITQKTYKTSEGTDEMIGYVDEDNEDILRPLIDNKLEMEVLDWLVNLRDEMDSLGIRDLFGEDFKLSNIGETKDGRIVCFDF